METSVPLLVVINAEAEDHAVLDDIFRSVKARVFYFKTFQQALAVLDMASVVLCDEELSDASWRNVLRRLEEMPEPPVLIVAAPFIDNLLWAAVLNEGGHDVLAKPFRATEVLQSVASGLRRRQTRNESRQERRYRSAP